MIKRMSTYFLMMAMCAFVAPTAFGADDCCWDWSPKEPGKADAGGGQPFNNPDTVWAECVKAPTKGPSETPQDSPCFQRDGRQMVWQGWECRKDPEGVSPDGKPASDPGVTDFFCFKKNDPGAGVEGSQMKKMPPTPGPNGPDGTGVREGAVVVNCVVKCKDAARGENIAADLPSCHGFCDGICGGPAGVFSCFYNDQNVKGNCDVRCKDGSSEHGQTTNANDCHDQCDTFCGKDENVISCVFKGEKLKTSILGVCEQRQDSGICDQVGEDVMFQDETWDQYSCKPAPRNAPDGSVTRTEIIVGKATQDFKLDRTLFVCESTGEKVAGAFKKHHKDVSTGPLPDREVWGADFAKNCPGKVSVYVHHVDPMNHPVIKDVIFHMAWDWSCIPDNPTRRFNRIDVHIGKATQDFTLSGALFVCKNNPNDPRSKVTGVFKGHQKDVNEDPLLPHHEIWSGDFEKSCKKGVDVYLQPVDQQNKPIIKQVTFDLVLGVPAVTEWGYFVLLLMVGTAGTIVFRRARSVAVVASGQTMVAPGAAASLFAPVVFTKVLAVVLALAVVGLAAATWLNVPLAARDVAGTVIIVGLAAYMAHLWVLITRESRK